MRVKLRQVRDSSQLPISLELGTQQVQGITIDNYSGYWLQIGSQAMFVPPYTIGWANNFDGQTAGSINVQKRPPSGIITNPLVGQEAAVIAAVYDEPVAPNPGLVVASRPIQVRQEVANPGAGTVTVDIFNEAILIVGLTLSGQATAAALGIGHVKPFMQDNNFAIALLPGILVSTLGVTNSDIPINSSSLANLNPLALPWLFRVTTFALVGGPLLFPFMANIIYQ